MLSIVVPTYNERGNMRALLERTLGVFDSIEEDAELILVDDDSPDGTADEAMRLAALLEAGDRVNVVRRMEDRGLSKSVVEGVRQARGDVVVVMDADLSHPPEVLPSMLQPIRAGEADIVVASRRVRGGGVENWPLSRRFASWFAGVLARPLAPVRDTTSGFFAFRKQLLEGVDLRPRGYKILLDVLIRTGARRVREVPFIFTDRTAEVSKLGGSVIFAYLEQLVELYRIKYPRLARYAQFALVGCVGAVVDALLFLVLFRVLHTTQFGFEGGHFVAQGFAFGGAVWLTYRLNARFTFVESARHARAVTYVGVCLAGALIRHAVAVAVSGVGVASSPGALVQGGLAGCAALCAGLFVASIWNFAASRRFVFPVTGSPAHVQPDERRAQRAVWFLVLGLLGFHALYGGSLDLSADEAYYWQWARGAHLAVGYHDHPPFVAYMIRVGTYFAGTNPLGVRIVNTVFLAGLILLVVQITRQWVRVAPRPAGTAGPWVAGLWAGGACLAAPVFGLNGILALPDTPLLFFWTATIALTFLALDSKRIWPWIATGVVLGLGMLSKYQMALLPPSLLVALLCSARGRLALKGPGPYVAVGVGALLCLPFGLWVIQNDFGGLRFQARHGLGGDQQRTVLDAVNSVGRFFGGQLVGLSPVLFCFVGWFVLRSAREILSRHKGRENATSELASAFLPILVIPSLVVFVVFLYASLGARPEVHWPSVAYPTAFVLCGTAFARWYRTGGQWRMHALVAVGLAALITAAAHVEVARPTLMTSGFFTKIVARKPFGKWFEGVRRHHGPPGLEAPVLTDSYQTASLLAFYLPDHPPTAAPFERGSGQQYTHWRSELPLRTGERAWFVTIWKDDPRLPTVFSEFEFDSTHACLRLGEATHTYHAYWGKLRGEPLGPETE